MLIDDVTIRLVAGDGGRGAVAFQKVRLLQGPTGGSGNGIDGYIAECGIYDTVLSGGNIASLEAYLNGKWSVF